MSIQAREEFSGRIRFEWIGESFEIYKRDWPVWIVALLLSRLISAPINLAFNWDIYTVLWPSLLLGHGTGGYVSPGPWHSIVSAIIELPFATFGIAGLASMGLRAVRGERLAIGDFFRGFRYYFSFLIYTIVCNLLTIVGALACCIGIFPASAIVLPMPAMLADGRGFGRVFNEGTSGMSKDLWKGSLFMLLISLLVIAALIPLFLGMFIISPMIVIISALAYRDMIDPSAFGQSFASILPTIEPGSWPPKPVDPEERQSDEPPSEDGQ